MPSPAEHPLPSRGSNPTPLTTPLPPDTPELDETQDWEFEAPPREDDPYRSYSEESEPRGEDEWLGESYILAAPSDPGPEQFAVGRVADAMAPGPGLAILADAAWRDGLGRLDDDQLTGVLQAAARLGSWSATLKLAATSQLAARREADGHRSKDWRPFDHVDDEVAVALTLTRRSAGRLLDLALALDRLPLTRDALRAGLIDERRAEVIAEELSGLDDEHAAAVEQQLIGKAPGLTTGQLRALARRLVVSADPTAARRRKEAALRDARVEAFTEHAGTAGLSGRDLCATDVLAADRHLTALAQAMKAAGTGGTMDTLRAHAYLYLLTGHPASDLFPQSTAAPATPDPAAPDSSPPSTPGAPASTPPRPSGAAGGGTGLRGTVNLTMPLTTWLGWTQSPGDVPGFGPLDADDSRTLAGLLARNPANRWCVTLTDRAGHPAAHACTPCGPGSRPKPPGPGTPAPGSPGTPAPGSPDTTGPPATGPPGWLRGLTFASLATGTCSHSRESRGYQPSVALRHLIQIRNPACTAPGCRRNAARCDLDHVTPYDRGGRTCECNLHPACRHHHKTKQTPGWTLTTPSPGTLTWTTPGHRTHTTTPTQYWE